MSETKWNQNPPATGVGPEARDLCIPAAATGASGSVQVTVEAVAQIRPVGMWGTMGARYVCVEQGSPRQLWVHVQLPVPAVGVSQCPWGLVCPGASNWQEWDPEVLNGQSEPN